MRILVFGAGVLGCNLANNLFRAGKDVTLLARGSWAEEIRTNGLRIKNKFSPRLTVSRIPVVTELLPDDPYDVILWLSVIRRSTRFRTPCVQACEEHRLCRQQCACSGACRLLQSVAERGALPKYPV